MTIVDDILADTPHDADADPYIGIAIIDNGDIARAVLGYRADTRTPVTDWYLDLYSGYHYNGPKVEVTDSTAKRMLKNLVGDDFSQLSEKDYCEIECDECPHE